MYMDVSIHLRNFSLNAVHGKYFFPTTNVIFLFVYEMVSIADQMTIEV
jgi:hypothetical protein